MRSDDETLLSGYLDGELEPALKKQVESELLSDPALAEELRRLTAVHEVLAAQGRPRLPADVSGAVLAALAQRRAPSASSARPDRQRRLRIAFEMASAAVIVLALGLGLRSALRDLRPGRLPLAAVPTKNVPRAGDRPGSPPLAEVTDGAPRRIEIPAPPEPTPSSASNRLLQANASDGPGRERAAFDPSKVSRIFFVLDEIGGNAAEEVDALVKKTPRVDSSYGRITIAQEIVLDPTHPRIGAVFALEVDDHERDGLRSSLAARFPDSVKESSPDPTILARLAQAGPITLLAGTPARVSAPSPARLLPPPMDRTPTKMSTVLDRAREKPLVRVPIPDEFEGLPVTEVQEVGPVRPGQEEPTPEQERSGPHPSTRDLTDSQASPLLVEHPRQNPPQPSTPRDPGTDRTIRRRTSIVLVCVATRQRAAAGRR